MKSILSQLIAACQGALDDVTVGENYANSVMTIEEYRAIKRALEVATLYHAERSMLLQAREENPELHFDDDALYSNVDPECGLDLEGGVWVQGWVFISQKITGWEAP